MTMSSLSAVQSLLQTVNNNFAVYKTALAQSPSGVCGSSTTAPPALAALKNALAACDQLAPLFAGAVWLYALSERISFGEALNRIARATASSGRLLVAPWA